MHLKPYDATRWLALATMWSFQYIFLRVAVPAFGTPAVAEGRALAASLFLVPWAIWFARQRIGFVEHWKDHLAVALVNNVLPFVCFAWAAGVLPAGYLAVINGMVPLWAAVIAVPVLKERLGAARVAGFALGVVGVALIVNLGPVELNLLTVSGTLVAVIGAGFWGWAGVMIKQRAGKLPPMGLAAGSIAFSAILMAPLWVTAPSPSTWTTPAVLSLIGVGVVCSGLAYLPFFTLVRDIGPSRTLTVGLAVPVLGILWGWLLLDEAVTLGMLAGAALVMAALGLVLRR
ncbi:MAG TPA: DMT family transporter [Burkholderiales bacterium]|nr:DMT family transporter [Burkholderiales bacterium]